METEKSYSVEEILAAAREGRISGPVGMGTCLIVTVDGQGQMQWAGPVTPAHADEIAFQLMAAKRRPPEKVEQD